MSTNPHDDPPQNLLRLRSTRELARTLVEAYHRRKNAGDAPVAPALALVVTDEELESGVVMAEQNPPLLTPAERAASDSTNGKMAKLLMEGS